MIIVRVKIESVAGRGVGAKTEVSGLPCSDTEKLLLCCVRRGIESGLAMMDQIMQAAGEPPRESLDGAAADVAEKAAQQASAAEGN